MHITVIHGIGHHGSTYEITQLFLKQFEKDTTRLQQFFLPKDMPHFCVGCFNCFTKGEHACPHATTIMPLVSALESADLIILTSPTYVFGMTGQMKAFLDHLAYMWMPHRPKGKMFHKRALIITTASGAGTKSVIKSLKTNCFYWGIPRTFSFKANVAAMNWKDVSDSKKKNITLSISKLSPKIITSITHHPLGLKTRFLFRIMRMMQKGNNWNMTDRDHWKSAGWLEKIRPWKD